MPRPSPSDTSLPLRGLVLGFYHRRNAGDDRLALCIEKWLADHELTFLAHTEALPSNFVNRYDYVILGGGSILDGWHGASEHLLNWQEHLDIPVFVVSATICSLDPNLLKDLRRLAQLGPRIWLRDARSARILDADQGVSVAPDITWMYPLEPTVPLDRDLPAIANLRPWEGIERHVEPLRERMSRRFARVHPWCLCQGKDADEALSRAVSTEAAATDFFDPLLVARASFALVMRYHAVIFAIQAGTPFLALENTKKVAGLLEDLDLTRASVSPDAGSATLLEAIDGVLKKLSPALLREITLTKQRESRSAAALFLTEIERTALERRVARKSLPSRVRRKLHGLLTPS